MNDTPPEGQLFRLNYQQSATRHADSMRARRRFATLVARRLAHEDQSRQFAKLVEGEIGIPYPYGLMDYDHQAFAVGSELGDFLSVITLFHRFLGHSSKDLTNLRRIIEEEQLHYKIDDQGGVHFLVDQQFSVLVETTLAGLGAQRFSASKDALEDALSALGPASQSGKALIRNVFEAVESAFLVIISQANVNRINKQSIDAHLKPNLLNHYDGVPEREDKVDRMLAILKAWVNSAHPYRHGVNFEDIHEAPLDEAILSATVGMGFLRFLVQMDQASTV